jgi:hypothetical protein
MQAKKKSARPRRRVIEGRDLLAPAWKLRWPTGRRYCGIPGWRRKAMSATKEQDGERNRSRRENRHPFINSHRLFLERCHTPAFRVILLS